MRRVGRREGLDRFDLGLGRQRAGEHRAHAVDEPAVRVHDHALQPVVLADPIVFFKRRRHRRNTNLRVLIVVGPLRVLVVVGPSPQPP